MHYLLIAINNSSSANWKSGKKISLLDSSDKNLCLNEF